MSAALQVADSVEDLTPKCIAHCQEFSVEALQTSQVDQHHPLLARVARHPIPALNKAYDCMNMMLYAWSHLLTPFWG